jgi:hypothetical protein
VAYRESEASEGPKAKEDYRASGVYKENGASGGSRACQSQGPQAGTGEQPKEEIQGPRAVQAPEDLLEIASPAQQVLRAPQALSPAPKDLLEKASPAQQVLRAPQARCQAPEDLLENKAPLENEALQGVKAIRASQEGMEEMACQDFRASQASADIPVLPGDRALFLDLLGPKAKEAYRASGGRPAREENGDCLGTEETLDIQARQADRALFLDRLGPKAKEDYRASAAYRENEASEGRPEREERRDRADMRDPQGSRGAMAEMAGMEYQECLAPLEPLGWQDVTEL